MISTYELGDQPLYHSEDTIVLFRSEHGTASYYG